MQDMLDEYACLSDSDERLLANITRASSPDTSGSDPDSAGRGAALVKRPWTEEEDELLIAAVRKYGACRWSMIATQLSSGRVGKQCRERWNNHLCPEVKKTEWSEEEDRSIMQGVAVLGTRWCEIVKAPALCGRTDNAIKNRFYSLQRRMKARLNGGHRAGRRAQGPAHEMGNSTEHLGHTEKIMALATELAFATDECERDRLIEQLTEVLHENQPVDVLAYNGQNEDDHDDVGDLMGSPGALSELQKMSQGLPVPAIVASNATTLAPATAAAGVSAPQSYDEDASLFATAEPPTPVPAGILSSEEGLSAATTAALVPSVKAVADLLKLSDEPLSGATADFTTVRSAKNPTAAVSPDTTVAEGDDAASACSTISPDVHMAGGAGAASEADAWKLPAKTTAAVATNGSVLAKPAAATVGFATKTEALADETNLSASLLGGRQAYKALLAPLRLPESQLVDVDSPKRMRTPSGAHTPGGTAIATARPRSALKNMHVCAATANAPTAVATLPSAIPLVAAAAGTEEPGAVRASTTTTTAASATTNDALNNFSPTSPMSELNLFGLFGDLFNEGGALADKNTVKHTDSLDSSGTATTADVQMTDVSETALKAVSPETGSTITATAVKASPLGVGTRRSARACAGAKRTATESGVKSVRFSASYAEVVSEI